jgi:hypothetical protein
MKRGPFAPGGLCCPADRHYYDPLRLPLDHAPLPGIAGYRRASLPATPQATGPRRLSPVPRTTVRPFNAQYAGGFLGARSRIPGAFHGLRRRRTGSAPPLPRPQAGSLTTLAQASLALQTGRLLRPASHPASRPRTGASLPGTRASPRTGLTPAGRPELVARLRHVGLLSFTAPEQSGRTRRRQHRRVGTWVSTVTALPALAAARRPFREAPGLKPRRLLVGTERKR